MISQLMLVVLCSMLSIVYAEEIPAKTFPAKDIAGIKVDVDYASIRIEASDKDVIEVEQLPDNAKVCNISMDIKGKELFLQAHKKEEYKHSNIFPPKEYKIGFIVRTPKTININAISVTENIIISGINGAMKVESRTGKIALNDVAGTINAVTRTGNISGDINSSDVEAMTRTGNINLEWNKRPSKGEINVVSETGKIALLFPAKVDGASEVSSPKINIESQSGSINVKGLGGAIQAQNKTSNINLEWTTPPIAGNIIVESSTGKIDLIFPAESKFFAKLHTKTGKINNMFENINVGSENVQLLVKNNTGNISVVKQ